MKKWSFCVLFLVVISLLCPLPDAESQQGHKPNHGNVAAVPPGTEPAPVFPLLAEPGKKVPIGNDYYFIYGFDKKPKLGTMIMKVEIFTKEGKKDTSFEVKADSGMPSMKGAHESGDHSFKLSKKGDYLLPIDIVMPGGWEVRFTFSKDGKVIFRGGYQFNV